MSMMFRDIPDGSNFKDGNGRKYVKLQTLTASGNKQSHNRVVEGSDTLLPYNSIDFDGVAASCPDFLLVEIIS